MSTKSMKKFLVGVFAVLGFLTTLFAIYTLNFGRGVGGMPRDTLVIGSVKSPDGAYKAVVYGSSGGGAISPYCINGVLVVSAAISDAGAWDSDTGVFDAGCSGFDVDRGSLQKLVVWKSARNLQITFDPTLASDGAIVTLHGYAGKDGEVRITYATDR